MHTADGPEQIRVLRVAARQNVAVGDDDFRLDKVVNRQAVFACQPSIAAAKGQTATA